MANHPYTDTKIGNTGALGPFQIRPVPVFDDPLYTIEPQYLHRPDLLAYDLYKDRSCGGYLRKEI